MLAVVSTSSGPQLEDVPPPTLGPSEVLIKVRACALNRADLSMLQGAQHGRAGGVGAVLGLEWAGDVVETGPEVPILRAGDQVMGSGGGAYAEYATADWGRVFAVPAGLSYEQAATLPVALQTMHDAIVTHGRLSAGQSVLIQGASSAVGLMGLQIAKALGAGLVIGTSTNEDRRGRLHEFGADLAINSADEGWVAKVLEATGGKGVDLLIDQVSGDLMNGNLQAARIGGRIVNVGRLGGMQGPFDFNLHALRRITYVGVTFRTRSVEEVREITKKTEADLGAALRAGSFRLPIDSVSPLADAVEAFARMRQNKHFGKIVLVPGSTSDAPDRTKAVQKPKAPGPGRHSNARKYNAFEQTPYRTSKRRRI